MISLIFKKVSESVVFTLFINEIEEEKGRAVLRQDLMKNILKDAFFCTSCVTHSTGPFEDWQYSISLKKEFYTSA